MVIVKIHFCAASTNMQASIDAPAASLLKQAYLATPQARDLQRMQDARCNHENEHFKLTLPEVEGPLYIDVSVLLSLSLPTLLLRADTPLLLTGTLWSSKAGLCSSSMGQRHLRKYCLRQAGSVLNQSGGKKPFSHSDTA